MKEVCTLTRVVVSIQRGEEDIQKVLFFAIIVLIILGNISLIAANQLKLYIATSH